MHSVSDGSSRGGAISLLVTVKAYPAISRRHGEAVCVAGVRTDRPGGWVRLWPMQFRDLPFAHRFQKYQVIRLQVGRSSDRRPESFRPVADSMSVGRLVGTTKGWSERKQYVNPLVVESMCTIADQQRRDGTSLGVFRPREVLDLVIEKDDAEWDGGKMAVISQPSLFAPDKTALKKIPYRFKYRYKCVTSGCPTHEQSVIDWEIGQAFLSWTQYPERERLNKIRDKWLGELCAVERDTHFFVGNQHLFPTSFVVLGVFYPPKVVDSSPEQLPLALA